MVGRETAIDVAARADITLDFGIGIRLCVMVVDTGAVMATGGAVDLGNGRLGQLAI